MKVKMKLTRLQFTAFTPESIEKIYQRQVFWLSRFLHPSRSDSYRGSGLVFTETQICFT